MDEHSLQSPFIYDLYCHSLRPTSRGKRINPAVESLRKQLVLDKTLITQNSMGSGSSLSFARARRVSQITKFGTSSAVQSGVLVNLIEQFGCNSILELGTSLGLNTIYLSQSRGVKQVVTIEGNQELAHKAEKHFNQLSINNINLKVSDIDVFMKTNQDTFDMIYIDANHTYEATKRYFDKASQILNHQGIIIIDDINWSPDMTKAWTYLTAKKSFLTVENDKLGIVFVGRSFTKDDYILRF